MGLAHCGNSSEVPGEVFDQTRPVVSVVRKLPSDYLVRDGGIVLVRAVELLANIAVVDVLLEFVTTLGVSQNDDVVRDFIVSLLAGALRPVRLLHCVLKFGKCVLLADSDPQDFTRAATLYSPVPAVDTAELILRGFRELVECIACDNKVG